MLRDMHWQPSFSPHHLNALTNKQDFIWLSSFPISQGLLPIIFALEKDHHEYTIDTYWYYLRTTLPGGTIKTFYSYDYGLNRTDIHRVFDDKIICWKIAEQAGIRTPPSLLLVAEHSAFSQPFNNRSSAEKFATQYWFPLIMKPINGRQGRGVQKIVSMDHLYRALDIFNGKEWWSLYCMLQPLVEWDDIRVIYLDGQIELAYKRVPFHVVWDGLHTIGSLIETKKQEEVNYEEIELYLTHHGHTLKDIPSPWVHIQLLPTANISTWWTAEKVPTNKEDLLFMQKIADLFGATYLWADIITRWSIASGTLIELNKMPWFTWANLVQPWFSDQLGEKIWEVVKKQERGSL